MAKCWKNNLAIWSHWYLDQVQLTKELDINSDKKCARNANKMARTKNGLLAPHNNYIRQLLSKFLDNKNVFQPGVPPWLGGFV